MLRGRGQTGKDRNNERKKGKIYEEKNKLAKASIWEWLRRTRHDQGVLGMASLSWIRILSNLRRKQNKCLGLATGTLGNTTINSCLNKFQWKFSHRWKSCPGLPLSWESTGDHSVLLFKQWKCRERSRKVSMWSVIICIYYRCLTPKETITHKKIYYCRISIF